MISLLSGRVIKMDLKELKILHKRLGDLIEDPHLGLSTWCEAFSNVCYEIGLYCGRDVIMEDGRSGIDVKWWIAPYWTWLEYPMFIDDVGFVPIRAEASVGYKGGHYDE